MLSYSTRVQDGKVNTAKSRLTFEMLSVNGVNKREWAECASALDKRDWVWDLRVGRKATHSEGGICPELQQTLDSRQAQVGRGDVQGRAEVKVAAGGVDLCGDTGVTRADIFFSMWPFFISHPQPNWRAQTFPLRWKKKTGRFCSIARRCRSRSPKSLGSKFHLTEHGLGWAERERLTQPLQLILHIMSGPGHRRAPTEKVGEMLGADMNQLYWAQPELDRPQQQKIYI